MEDPGSLSALVLGCIDRSCREIPCLPLPAHRRLASRPRGGWGYGSKPIPSRPRFCFAWQLLKVALAAVSESPNLFGSVPTPAQIEVLLDAKLERLLFPQCFQV